MAAVPTSFFEMLPTLLNPVRGGGDHAWGGTTLTAIGASLEALAVQGFIFPSARGDARVLFDNGTMVSFAGWCFVDLSESPNRSRKAVVDPSPWSWHWLPTGATLVAAQEGTPPAGSFAISGMVEGSRREYLFKVECLAAARARLGATSPEFEALLLGQYSIRWLRSALIPALHRAIDELKVACGLTLRRGEEWIAGKYHWLFNTMLSGDKQVNILEELKTLAEKLAGTVTDKQQREIVLVGMELELIRLQVQIFRRMSMTSLPEELATRRLVAISLPQAGASTVTKLATLVGKVGAPLDECDHVGEAVGSLLEEHFGASASTCSPSSSAGATRAPA